MRRIALIIILALYPCVARAQMSETPRVLRTFDFEERRLGNVEDLPMHWEKVDGPGLPHYINGRLTAGPARSGRYSFRFDLDGGSLIYRYAPGRILVSPGAHYHIEGYCKTTALRFARARITACFVDQDGRTLPGSAAHSDLYAAHDADDDWHALSLDLTAPAPDAGAVRHGAMAPASLTIELELLQPELFEPPALGSRTLNRQDIHGAAWFDDITVAQTPRITMTTDCPGNVIRRNARARLNVVVDDTFTDDLSAQLLVRDAGGKLVYQRSGALDRAGGEETGAGRLRVGLNLPALPAGWYSAQLAISSGKQPLGIRSLAFVQLADDFPAGAPDGRFGFVATDLPQAGWDELPLILPGLSAGRVKLALWSEAGEADPAEFDALLERLQGLGITPTACLLDLPGPIGAALDADAIARAPDPEHLAPLTGWARVVDADPRLWQTPLALLISRHANHLDRWQLGADGSDAFVTSPKMRQAYQRVYDEFARLVEKPDLAMPWPAWCEPDRNLPSTVALSVPARLVQPSQLPLYVQDLLSPPAANPAPANGSSAPATGDSAPASAALGPAPRAVSLSLRWLDAAQVGNEAQIRDAAERVVYALASGAQRIDLPLPFTTRIEADGSIVKEPTLLLPVLRTLIMSLGGATYKGKVPVGENVEAFLFDRDGQGILVVWDRAGGAPRAGAAGAARRELTLNLGDHPVCVDLWGNARALLAEPRRPEAAAGDGSGRVALALGALPVILVGIDGPRAQLRGSVGLDRPMIESTFQPHGRRLHFVNAYRTPISGTVRLRPPAGWTVNPPAIDFNLNPGETFDQPIEIDIPFNVVAGSHVIQARFTIPGDRTTQFTAPIAVDLGLSDVGMQTIAIRDGADVVIEQTIANYGDLPINYSAFALLPGQARQERLVVNLAPGRRSVKHYRFRGVPPQPGQRARVGLREIDGTRLLNDDPLLN